ncbi:PfkB family carbohydrate kinase [Actinoplanes sichuanensis]|uniref:PfkB family carbohydrate kinase n=1 Tax=Actinoplanes sichuanensis TaxID=512349 RepID=A0ABW4A5L2_9ACTN|nr:PfkB family carbohydrate kinase [Actinoplanes sichuanensis]BEL07489.1 PfkB family carbohydrate kinase [Actinoplanes sichuanensis]
MRLLFAGLATVDLVQRVERFPGPDEKVQSASVDVAAGGPAANAAVTAAALGATVTLVSAVGAHPLGDLVRADLATHGVTLIDIAADSPEPPPVSAVTVLASTGERTIVSRNAGNRTVAAPADGLPDADLTLVDGHHPGLAVAAARSARRLLVDAGSWRPVFADVFPHAEVVACSGDFRHPDATAGTDEATAAAVRAVGVTNVVITHGPEPVHWYGPAGTRGSVPVPVVSAVDTAGAGDAFHGALAVALARGDLDLKATIAYASRIAAIRVTHAGPRAWLSHLP